MWGLAYGSDKKSTGPSNGADSSNTSSSVSNIKFDLKSSGVISYNVTITNYGTISGTDPGLSLIIDGTICGKLEVTNGGSIAGCSTSGSGCINGEINLPSGCAAASSWTTGNCALCTRVAEAKEDDGGKGAIETTVGESATTHELTATTRSFSDNADALAVDGMRINKDASPCPAISGTNIDFTCSTNAIATQRSVVACGYNACKQKFNVPAHVLDQMLGVAGSQPTSPRVALDDYGHGLVVWQGQDVFGNSHAYACSYDYDVATGDFGSTFTLASSAQTFTPDADLGGCGCGIIAWAQTSTADDKRADIWACTYNPVTKELGTALLISDGTKNAVEPRVACDCRHRACVVWRQANADGTTYSVWANVYNMTGAREFGGPTNISLAGPAELGNAHNLSLVKLDNRGRYRAIWQQVVGVDSFGKPITNVFARAYAACYGRWGSVVNMSSPCDAGGTIDGSNDACSGKMASNMRGGTLVAWQTTPTGTDDYAIWACRCATFGPQKMPPTACKQTNP